MTVRGSEKSVEARLRCGRGAGWGGGRVRPGGRGRPREIATFAGPVVVQPRRGICRGCGRTHVLLPAWLLSRRRYAAAVIFAALALRAAGLKVIAVAARLRLPVPDRAGECWSVPASTAGSWLSRFASRAGALRRMFLAVLPLADPLGRLVAAAGSVTGDVLAVVAAGIAGAGARFARPDTVGAHVAGARPTRGPPLPPPLPPPAGETPPAPRAPACASS